MKTVSATSSLWHETAGNGPPVVMLPGGPGFSHDYLRPHLDRLAETATLVWLDLPGTGRSDIEGGAGSITHELWIEELEMLRAHIGFERWTVFGHSYGGFVAVDYAIAHPESVSGLVLCASAPSGAHFETLFDRIPSGMSAADRDMLVQLLSGGVPDRDLEARVRDAVRFFLCGEPQASTLERFRLRPETFKHVLGNCLPELTIKDRLGEVTAPTLVVAGSADWQCPAEITNRLVAGIPNTELATIEEAGHYPFIDQPVAVVEAVRTWMRRSVLP